jgi:hypothetical protein
LKRAALLLLVLLVFGCSPEDPRASSFLGQLTSVHIDNAYPVCRECRVELREVVLLGSPGDPASVSEEISGSLCMVGRLSTGEYAVGGIVGGGEIFVYDPKGRVVRTFGRAGEGPGEFSDQVSLVVGQGDTLYVLDGPQARLSVFTADGEFVRSFSVSSQIRSYALVDNGGLLFSRRSLEPEGSPFFLTSPDGDDLRPFGRESSDPRSLNDYLVAPAHPGGFWTASVWSYGLHRWRGPDVVEQTVTREVDWFPPNGEYVEGMPFSVPAAPTLSHIWDDGNSRIWVYTVVADASWEEGIPLDPRHEWTRRTFDTVLEVLDLKERQVIVADRYDQLLGMVCGSPLVYTVVEADDGDTRLRIMEPNIVGLVAKGTEGERRLNW